MNEIGWAVKQLRDGRRVVRSGWNGKGMYLELQVPDAHSKMTLPYVYMRTAQGDLVPWLCSQTDLLAMDWDFVAADVTQPAPETIGTGMADDPVVRSESERGGG